MNKKFTDEEIVKAAHCCTENSCGTCPLRELGAGFKECVIKFSEYIAKYIANNTKNEPAPSANGTSSEVSLSDTKKILAHLDDSTLLDICQEALRNIADRVAEVNGGDDYIQGYANAVTDVICKLKGAN